MTATPPTTPVVTPAPTARNVSLNQTDHAAAFGEVTRNVTPEYQFSHCPRRQPLTRTLYFVWNESKTWISPFVNSLSMKPVNYRVLTMIVICRWYLSAEPIPFTNTCYVYLRCT